MASFPKISGSKTQISRRTLVQTMLLASAAPLIAACQSDYRPKHLQPLPAALKLKMERLSMREGDPIFMRIFKEEAQLEVWKLAPDGRYALLESYDICTWSGVLGPKFQEGDRQAPEGFYPVTPAQMNPNSSFYLSFNLGFPNAYDRSHGRTGSYLMVHGACSSAGCYAMTDEQISEIYGLAREAFDGGQAAFQVHAFPFRMTPENMARHANHEHFAFWQMLQEGYQHFELTRIPPKIDVCDRRYIFNAVAAEQFSAAEQCPAFTMPEPIASAFQAAQAEHQAAFELAFAEISPGVAPPPALAGVETLVEPTQVATPAAAPAPAATQVAAPAAAPASVPAPAPTPVVAPVETAVPVPPVEPVLVPEVVPEVAAEPVVETATVEAAAETTGSAFEDRAGSLFDRLTSTN